MINTTMLKIKINTHTYKGMVEFEVHHVQYELDEEGLPIDIVVVGAEDTLKELADYALIGCNMQALNVDVWPYNEYMTFQALGATHEMLIARLPEFTIEGDCKVIYKAI